MDEDELKRITDTWLAVEDCLIVSTPELLERPSKVIWNYWKWVMNVSLTHGIKYFHKMWKAQSAYLIGKALRSLELGAKIVTGTINFYKGEWCPTKLTLRSPLSWLKHVFEDSPRNKDLMTRIAHLTTSRNFPNPTKDDMEEAMNAHASIVINEVNPWNHSADLNRIYECSKKIGVGVRPKPDAYTNAHVSLTNSASMESSRRDGGRATEIGKSFAEWASKPSTETRIAQTYFGQIYRTELGKPRFHTMCRLTNLPDTARLIESDNNFEINIEDYKVEDPIYGLDQYTGYQLLQWSIEEGIDRGRLDGTYWDSGQPLRVGSPSEVKPSPVGEPGFKARTVTVAEAWYTMFLSPFGHELIGLLKQDPRARCGLGGAYQGFEFAKEVHLCTPYADQIYGLSSDLEQASEYIPHDVGKAILNGFIDGLGFVSPYYKTCIDLLLSNQMLYSESPKYRYHGCFVSRGSLMGHPGTKALLTLFMIVAESLAFEDWRDLNPSSPVDWRLFRTAGDDHVALGPLPYLQSITSYMVYLGGKIGGAKIYYSPIGVRYCEEFVLFKHPGLPTTNGKRPIMVRSPYDSTPHVDAIKVRLLCPLTVITVMRNEKNPAIGKAQQLCQMMGYLPEGWLNIKILLSKRFIQRYKPFCDWSNPFTYLNKWMGGLGFLLTSTYVEKTIENLFNLPEVVKRALALSHYGIDCQVESRILQSFSNNTLYRGVTHRTIGEESTLSAMQCLGFEESEETIRALLGLDSTTWDNLKNTDKSWKAKSVGYIRQSEFIQLLERPTYFKEVLAGAPSDLHRSDEYIRFRTLESTLMYVAESEGHMLISDVNQSHPDIVSEYLDARKRYHDLHIQAETYYYTRISGNPEGLHLPDFLLERERTLKRRFKELPLPDEEDLLDPHKGFNTLSWPARVRLLRRNLTLYGTDRLKQLTDEEVFAALCRIADKLLEEPSTGVLLIPADSRRITFIKRDRIGGSLCTLETKIK